MKLMKFFALALGVLAFVACGNDKPEETNKTTNNITLTANNNSVEVNTPITFTIVDKDGNDLTADAIILDKSHDYIEVSNPYIPTTDGEYVFIANVGNMIAPECKVYVVPTIPALPEDTNPSNTSFNHRILLVDHTGNTCGNCPNMMLAMKEVAEKEEIHNKYYEAMAHTYTNGDPAFSSAAAGVSSHFGVSAYPTLTYNFYHPTTSGPTASHIIGQINSLWKAEGADAGIAASASFAAKSVVVNIEVKAAVENEYCVTAWLLEDNVYAKQTNATEDWMNYHDNTIRQRVDSEAIQGYKLGNIAVGETKSTSATLKIAKDSWVRENMRVLIIASAKNAKGKFEVANVAVCPIEGSVLYDYK
ncbi:MAG: Omp28-related outer membrane protein [Alistipes sp.]|nr:Omp28-related outer membrane protein [Alistipes sp.]